MPSINYTEIVKEDIKARKKEKRKAEKKATREAFEAQMKQLEDAYIAALDAAVADPALIPQAVDALKACETKRDEYNQLNTNEGE